MADTSPLTGLLDRASTVFSLAWQLARAFTDECDRQGGSFRTVDPTAWGRQQPDFNVFCNALLELRTEMQNPPDGFAPVAEVLMEAARVAKQIRDVMQTTDGRMWQSFLDFRFHFNSIGAKGDEAVRAVTKARRLNDPFAFLDQPLAAAGRAPEIDTPPVAPEPLAADTGEREESLSVAPPVSTPGPKRSTERGEGRAKLIAALTKHHRYADGGSLNTEPVGNNELAKAADVSPSTASAFFEKEFQGHAKYRVLCRDAVRLAGALKLLNGEFAAHILYGHEPIDEGDRDAPE